MLGDVPNRPVMQIPTNEVELRSYPLKVTSSNDENLRAILDEFESAPSKEQVPQSENPDPLDIPNEAEEDEYQENPVGDGHEDPFNSPCDPSLCDQTRESSMHSISKCTIPHRPVSVEDVGQAAASASPKSSASCDLFKRSVNYGSRNRFSNERPNKALPQQERTLSLRTGGTDDAASRNYADSARGFASGSDIGRRKLDKRYFHSRRVRKADIERPWLEKKDPREKWLTIIPVVGIVVGLCIAGVLVWDGMRSVINHNYCEILDEDFSNGLDPRIWTLEAELGGFG